LTALTVSPLERQIVWKTGDLQLCRAADIQLRISAAREMKYGLIRITVDTMTRFPTGEKLDRIVAVCLAAVGVLIVWTGNVMPGMPKGLAALLTVAICAPVAVRRRWPLGSGIAVLLLVNLIFAFGANNYSPPIAIAWMCELYAIAVWTDTRGFLIGLAVLTASNFATLAGSSNTFQDAGFFTIVPIAAMIICRRAIRDRDARAETLAAQAALLERERELRTQEAVAEERARIARELHDLVAHNVSVMVVQAGAERHALPEDQASTREALSSIEQSGRQALTEARRLLGMLRKNGEHEELAPQPSIEQIDFLVEQIERAGLPVKLDVEGEPVKLPAGVDLCAYRVVQEGLTNALKHAGPAHAEVLLRYTGGGLDVRVRDDGRGLPQPNGDGAGHGLIGMRERVALYGGEIHTGPRGNGGGFEISAHIPLA
jgi:signal transduction histidine kinase